MGIQVFERAVHADQLLERIGICTHLNWDTQVWGQREAEWLEHWHMTKCRHTRSQVGKGGVGEKALARLKQMGAKITTNVGNGEFSTSESMQVLEFMAQRYAELVAYIEGENEPNNPADIKNDPDWKKKLRKHQQWLYNTVKTDVRLKHIPVAGPPAWGCIFSNMPDIRGSNDIAPGHYYNGGRIPTLRGVPNDQDEGGQAGTYSMDEFLADLLGYHGTKDFIITETGMSATGPGLKASAGIIPNRPAAKYLLRLALEFYRRGSLMTYLYSLIDDKRTPPRYHGQLTQVLKIKPQFTAVCNLLSLFNDPGPAFTPADITYELDIDDDTKCTRLPVHMRRNGSWLLPMWLNVPSYDQRTFQELEAPPVHVTVELPTAMNVRIHRPTFSTTPILESVASVVAVPVTDELTVLEVIP